jgi:hypothetical protein
MLTWAQRIAAAGASQPHWRKREAIVDRSRLARLA